jgi:tetratricopeptide (TPR) repeat protein
VRDNLRNEIGKAMGLVQSGDIDTARGIVSDIRSKYDVAESSDATIEIMIVEGMCCMYSGDINLAYDRFNRASIIASAFGSQQVRSMARCWLALCEFNTGRHIEAARSIVAVKEDISVARPEVRFRFALMLAMLLEYSNLRSGSAEWFAVARREAAKSGSSVLTSIGIFNLSMLRLGSSMIARLRKGGRVDRALHESDLLYIKSSENYDNMDGGRLQSELHSLARAQALAASERYEAAIEECRKFLDLKSSIAPADRARAMVCFGICSAELGLPFPDVKSLIKAVDDLTDNDDLALAHDLLGSVLSSCGDRGLSDWHRKKSKEHLDRYEAVGASIITLLSHSGLVQAPVGWD